MSGRFITFEGPDGSGKSTQAFLLSEKLCGLGIDCILTREPGGTAVGEAIRNILQHDSVGDGMNSLTEIMLFEASRSALVASVIMPALEEEKWVICDRFADSTMAYQGYGREQDIEMIKMLNETAVQGLRPDLTVVLDIDVDDGMTRLEIRNQESGAVFDRMERECQDFHNRVKQGYLTIAKADPERCRIIPGTASVEKVANDVWSLVEMAFGDELS